MSDDGKDERKKEGEEEEELDCSHPEVVNKYQQAGAVANGPNLATSRSLPLPHSSCHKVCCSQLMTADFCGNV